MATATTTAAATHSVALVTWTIAYTYDGVQRLTGAVEAPGSSFAYSYDLAGNRTGVTVDGSAVLTDTYDAADQVVDWTYDAAGNLISDGGIQRGSADMPITLNSRSRRPALTDQLVNLTPLSIAVED
jgi:YD repeat-containing protein